MHLLALSHSLQLSTLHLLHVGASKSNLLVDRQWISFLPVMKYPASHVKVTALPPSTSLDDPARRSAAHATCACTGWAAR